MATNPFEFLQQTRSELAKVTWPTRRETLVTSAFVIVMVLLAGLFLFAVDQTISVLVNFVLGITA